VGIRDLCLPAALLAAACAVPGGVVPDQGPYDGRRLARFDIAFALDSAHADQKPVLLDFGANWCQPCRDLERIFSDPRVHPFLVQHFHVVRIDVGLFNHNVDVSDAYGSAMDGGIPAIVILSPGSQVLATTKGSWSWARDNETVFGVLGCLQDWARLAAPQAHRG